MLTVITLYIHGKNLNSNPKSKLIDIISNYQGFTNVETIVVFDGYNVKGNKESKIKFGNVEAVYTAEGQTADNYIEKAVKNYPSGIKIRVATSDYLEQIIVFGKGASRISARELHDEIFETETKIRKDYIDKRPPKKNMLADNLDEKTRIWLENMRLGKKWGFNMILEKYRNLSDENLFNLIENNDKEAMDALIDKYKVMVKAKARTYFIIGGDTEDLIQEGMIGLYNAIRDYDKEKSHFSTFAEVCVSRQILSAVKAASRQKHIPLNTYISLNNFANSNPEDNGLRFWDILKNSESTNPELLIIGEENKNNLIAHM